jgi:UDP-glucose 4-epimerase
MAGTLTHQRIAITGARSSLANVISRHFAGGGAQLIKYSRTGDAENRPLSELLLPGGSAGSDTLLHLAWSTVPYSAEQPTATPSQPDLDLLSRLLASLAATPPANRPHLIFFSSGGAVYGNAVAGRAHRESDTCLPPGRYGQTKLAAEKLIAEAGREHGLSWTILRIANPYGCAVPATRPQGIIPVALHHARDGKPLTIWGDGTARKDFLYHTDFTAALEKIIMLRPTGIFNVSSGQSHTIRELLALVEAATSRPLKTMHVPAHAWDVHDSILDNTKLRSTLAWQPTVSLADGICRMATG